MRRLGDGSWTQTSKREHNLISSYTILSCSSPTKYSFDQLIILHNTRSWTIKCEGWVIFFFKFTLSVLNILNLTYRFKKEHFCFNYPTYNTIQSAQLKLSGQKKRHCKLTWKKKKKINLRAYNDKLSFHPSLLITSSSLLGMNSIRLCRGSTLSTSSLLIWAGIIWIVLARVKILLRVTSALWIWLLISLRGTLSFQSSKEALFCSLDKVLPVGILTACMINYNRFFLIWCGCLNILSRQDFLV